MAKILLVEDNLPTATNIRDHLELDRHRVEMVNNGEDALAHLAVGDYDIIVLDMNLPGIDGTEVCRHYRHRGGNAHILMLTANDTMEAKEGGFVSGVDDYLTKPFHPRELSLRVQALLRRSDKLKQDILSYGTLTVDPISHVVTKQGRQIKLAPIEFDLLTFLLRHRGQVFSSEDLLVKVWPSDSERIPETIRVCVRKIRAKVDDPGETSIIENVHGVGYKIN